MGDINTSYYTGKAATGRLSKLGAFYNTFRQPWFPFVEDSTPLIIGNHIGRAHIAEALSYRRFTVQR